MTSYSNFLFRVRQPFLDQFTKENILKIVNYDENKLTQPVEPITDALSQFLQKLIDRFMELKQEIGVNLIPNKINVHCYDINYEWPDDYDFYKLTEKFIRNGGMLVFAHLDNYELIKIYLSIFQHNLSELQYPITGDTIWHLNPFLIDMLDARIYNLVNFRNESPNDLRTIYEIYNLPTIKQFPDDVNNQWIDGRDNIFANEELYCKSNPVTNCRYLKRIL